ncbi:uncharacterized protein JN550_008889 [Neoarthrinium moseri]|uniref:uncharacterized protein n=1 Tax=Neoarthrinium moseri TaxID=1658444 RepID=UPI001FDC8DF9|nr:uncharacterized protein JN550_008889 [Neoarthrinium moseri]KAI1864602.1 hypothetical protein JN550_008889 [Neoarthrinium moseri]
MALGAEEAPRSLGDSINIATRSVHTQLNKLIILRLPLAVPPQAEDPSNYVSGLLYIAPIYNAFESSWQKVLEAPVSAENNPATDRHSCEACGPASTVHHAPNVLDAPHQAVVCSRIHSLLEHVHTSSLERTEAIKEDIMSMTGWPSALLEEQLSSAAESPFLSAFVKHIRQAVQNRPHVLLAYAWVLYMALFSGGRFIKASLARIDQDFWTANLMTPSKHAEALPLNFFTFDGPDGGDEIKVAFKKRLAESESLLTAGEREDVIAEAKRIFEFMVEIVGELDSVCRTDPVESVDHDEGIMGRMSRLLGLRTRDSVVVTRERMTWAKLMVEQSAEDDEDAGAQTAGGGSPGIAEESSSSGSGSRGPALHDQGGEGVQFAGMDGSYEQRRGMMA